MKLKVFAVLALVVTICVTGICYAQARAAWTKDKALIAAYIDANSGAVVLRLEQMLTQVQIDELEAEWFPEATPEQKADAIGRMFLYAQEVGLERSNEQAYKDLVAALETARQAAIEGRQAEIERPVMPEGNP